MTRDTGAKVIAMREIICHTLIMGDKSHRQPAPAGTISNGGLGNDSR